MPASPAARRPPRIPVTVAAAVGLWLAYSALTFAIQRSSGIPYSDWFSNAGHAWRAAVLSLAAGLVLLLAFVRLAGWSHLWRDPRPLPATRLMRALMVLWWLAIALRLAVTDWARVSPDLLLAVLAAGVLVGLAEEILFRGVLLRALRARARPESRAALWTALCFGLFHLPNVLLGTGWPGLAQVLLAATGGVVLYAFRRATGRLWPAMLAHGSWDVSTFLASSAAPAWVALLMLLVQLVFVVGGIAVLAASWRHDRGLVVHPRDALS